MRRVRGKLCRTKKGRFTHCKGSSSGGGRRKRKCKYGRNKNTGRCLKRPRACQK